MGTKRIAYWDNWKGLAIIAVVMIHATSSAFQFSESSFNYNFGLWLRQIINYAVPMFLAMAGYFAASAVNETASYYYKKRVLRIIIPYGIWTTIYLAIKTPADFPGFKEIIGGYILGSGIGVGYFVIVLLQYVAVTPLLLKIKSLKTHALLIILLTVFGILFSYYFRTQQPTSFFARFPGSAIFFVVWYPFYHFGLVAALYKNQLGIEKISTRVLLISIIVTIAFSYAECFFWSYFEYYRLGYTQLKISSFAASLTLFIISIVYFHKETWLNSSSILTWIGRYSFAIYLIHMLFIRLTKIIPALNEIIDFQPLYIISTTIFSILGSAVVILTFKKIFPKQAVKYVLG